MSNLFVQLEREMGGGGEMEREREWERDVDGERETGHNRGQDMQAGKVPTWARECWQDYKPPLRLVFSEH